ncbi:MAG: D-glycero-beta-D-manno-heptose 1-phosphate adenylyltransferase [Pseudomonadota bacterium]
MRPVQPKIIPFERIAAVAEGLREKGSRIVFTNGCFDLLHIGHIRYLSAARDCGDCLVVGLNADESVHRIKGPERPVTPEDQRAEVLAALSCVDFITVFSEDTPKRLIAAVRPHVLVKGADWAEADIVGADIVRADGGDVVRIPVVKDVSTTGIIARIRSAQPPLPPGKTPR